MNESATDASERRLRRGRSADERRRRRIVRIIGLALVLVGFGTMVLRVFDPAPRAAAGDRAWQLLYTVELIATAGQSIVHLYPPWDTAHVRLFAQNITHPGMRRMRLRRVRPSVSVRDIVMAATRDGMVSVQAEFDIHVSSAPFPKVPRPSGRLSAERREALLAPEAAIQSDAPQIVDLARRLRTHQADRTALVDAIFGDVRGRPQPLAGAGRSDALGALTVGPADALARARLMVALCRASEIPARVVTGFVLAAEGPVQPAHWLQVLEGTTWQSFDPERGHARTLPQSYLPVRLGTDLMIDVEKAQAIRTYFHVYRIPLDTRNLASTDTGWRELLDLGRLSFSARSTLALLMLLPVAVVCTLAARRLIGVRSFGTFSPALLGLAATALDWRSTALVFTLVVLIAGAGRAIAPRLRLVRELRLGVVFLFVALGMAYAVSLLEHVGREPGDMVLLLPMVVLTMLVDRFYTVADEDGLGVALRRLGWTFALSVLAFAILLNEAWGHWLVLNPLTHAATLGLVILLGTYREKHAARGAAGRRGAAEE